MGVQAMRHDPRITYSPTPFICLHKRILPITTSCVNLVNSRLVVTGCYDGIIRVWDVKKKDKLNVGNYSGHQSHVNALCFDKDGSRLYSGDGNGVLRIWSTGPNSNPTSNDNLSSLYPVFSCIASIDTCLVAIIKILGVFY
jgi:WD40 repeat protein